MWLEERGWRGQGGSGVRIREGGRETQRGRRRMSLLETAGEADKVAQQYFLYIYVKAVTGQLQFWWVKEFLPSAAV